MPEGCAALVLYYFAVANVDTRIQAVQQAMLSAREFVKPETEVGVVEFSSVESRLVGDSSSARRRSNATALRPRSGQPAQREPYDAEQQQGQQQVGWQPRSFANPNHGVKGTSIEPV